jgi:glycerophosphoryl diester phosphodiesterase
MSPVERLRPHRLWSPRIHHRKHPAWALAAAAMVACLCSVAWLTTAPAVEARSIRAAAQDVVNTAHRGLVGHLRGAGPRYADEDTVWSCLNAVRHHVDECEFDVRLTKDGRPVVFHDPRLDRVTGCSGEVIDWTFAQLDRCRTEHRERIPHLKHFLAAVSEASPTILLNQELKPGPYSDEQFERILELDQKYGFDLTRMTLTSYSFRILTRLEAIAPDYSKGYISTTPVRLEDVPTDTVTELLLPYRAFERKLEHDPDYAAAVLDAGLGLAVWDAGGLAQMKQLVAQGVTNVISDESDVFEAWRDEEP